MELFLCRIGPTRSLIVALLICNNTIIINLNLDFLCHSLDKIKAEKEPIYNSKKDRKNKERERQTEETVDKDE